MEKMVYTSLDCLNYEDVMNSLFMEVSPSHLRMCTNKSKCQCECKYKYLMIKM